MLRIVSLSGSTANASIFWCHAESALKMSMPFRLPPKPKAGAPEHCVCASTVVGDMNERPAMTTMAAEPNSRDIELDIRIGRNTQ